MIIGGRGLRPTTAMQGGTKIAEKYHDYHDQEIMVYTYGYTCGIMYSICKYMYIDTYDII